jgi:PAS domain S-box-containing protein
MRVRNLSATNHTALAEPEHKTTTQRWSKANIGRRQRTTTPGHRSWRDRVLRDADYECDIRYAGICEGTATVLDHHIGVSMIDTFIEGGRGVPRPSLPTEPWSYQAMGATCTWHSLRPLLSEGQGVHRTRTQIAPRERLVGFTRCRRPPSRAMTAEWSAITMAILTVDTTGLILTWSREAEALLGYTEAEALGQSVEFIMPEHLRARHNAGFARYVQTGVSTLPEVMTSPMIHKNGETKRLLVSVQPVRDDQQTIVAVEATIRPRDGD